MDSENVEDPRSMEYLTNMLVKDVDFDIVIDIDGADDQDTSVVCHSDLVNTALQHKEIVSSFVLYTIRKNVNRQFV